MTELGAGVLFPQWGYDGYVYATADSGTIRFPATAGPQEAVTGLRDGDGGHRISDLLPGGDGALMLALLPDGTLEILGLDLSSRDLVPITFGEWAEYAPTGHIVYRAGDIDVWFKRADGTGAPELLLDLEQAIATVHWSPDGEWLIARTGGVGGVTGGRDIYGFRPGSGDEATPLLAEQFDEVGPAISPDGRWIAYTSRREWPVRALCSAVSGRQQRPCAGLDQRRLLAQMGAWRGGAVLHGQRAEPGLRADRGGRTVPRRRS